MTTSSVRAAFLGVLAILGVVGCISSKSPPAAALTSDPAVEISGSLNEALSEGSRLNGEMYGPRYSWAIEGLRDCPRGAITTYGVAEIVSSPVPLAHAMLALAADPDDREQIRSRLAKELAGSSAGTTPLPWQEVLCNNIEIATFIDPVAAGREDRGGEGQEMCDMMFPQFLCDLNAQSIGERFQPRYAVHEIQSLLLTEIERQREGLSTEWRARTQEMSVVVSYDNVFDLFTELPAAPDAKGPVLSISAILVRAVYVRCAIEAWQRLASSLTARPKRTMAMTFAELEAAAAALRSEFRRAFRFPLAHELAHVYLGDADHLLTDEIRVDCSAIVQLSRSETEISEGLFELLEQARKDGVETYWALTPRQSEDIDKRKQAFQRVVDRIQTSRAESLPAEYCSRAH